MHKNTTVLVTGASGFIGNALCHELAAKGYTLRAATRAATPKTGINLSHAVPAVWVPDISAETDWHAALDGVGVVVHLAARTHVVQDAARDPLVEYRHVNVAGTEKLARDAAACGVRRLVFLSSIKVNGERTNGTPFTEDEVPHPEDAYGVSKNETELALRNIASKTGLEIIVLRPPLVYGPGVKGNFLRLLDTIARGMPLPLASIDNRRSLIYLGNLIDAIRAVIDSPVAAGKTYLISDGIDLSTPQLIREIAGALRVEPRLFPCPVGVLKFLGNALGKPGEIARLVGSLQIDSARMRRELGWVPPYSPAQGIAATAQWYHACVAVPTRTK